MPQKSKTKHGFWSRLCPVTKRDLIEMEERIMSVISDYAAAVNTAFDAIDEALEEVKTNTTGLTDDLAYLKETIEKLNSNPGPISAEDQALLTAAQTRATAAAEKSKAVKDALKALNEATERPAEPPAEPPTPT